MKCQSCNHGEEQHYNYFSGDVPTICLEEICACTKYIPPKMIIITGVEL